MEFSTCHNVERIKILFLEQPGSCKFQLIAVKKETADDISYILLLQVITTITFQKTTSRKIICFVNKINILDYQLYTYFQFTANKDQIKNHEIEFRDVLLVVTRLV